MTQKIMCTHFMTGHLCISIWVNGVSFLCYSMRVTNREISPHSDLADYMKIFAEARVDQTEYLE